MITMKTLRKKIKAIGGNFRKYRGSNYHAYFYIKNVDGEIITNKYSGDLNIITINNLLFSNESKYVKWRLEKGLI